MSLIRPYAFLSTLSLRRATTPKLSRVVPTPIFLSTLSLRRATVCVRRRQQSGRISIHALLAESDTGPSLCLGILALFLSTLSLRRATIVYSGVIEKDAFLSTLSLRRATGRDLGGRMGCRHFYPRSPCGERPRRVLKCDNRAIISIHALLAESDPPRTCPRFLTFYFYPRSPCGERPNSQQERNNGHENFYPRSPCGERHRFVTSRQLPAPFLSTLSLRRATLPAYPPAYFLNISIHALLAESDLLGLHVRSHDIQFLSTLSLRRATHDDGT